MSIGKSVPVCCVLSRYAVSQLVEIDAESNRPPWTAAMFHQEFRSPFSRTFGVRIGGRLGGFGVIHLAVDEAHLVNFGVRRRLRGHGLGAHLLCYILDELVQEAIRVVTLEVRESNLTAQRLYEKVGFMNTGLRDRYYSDNQENALVLRLDLDDYLKQREVELQRAG